MNRYVADCSTGTSALQAVTAHHAAELAQLQRPEPVEPRPLDPPGALATLLAVTGAVSVADAANAVGLTADDLIHEAEAWAVAAESGP